MPAVDERKKDERKRRSSSPSLSYIFHPATRPVIAPPTREKPHCKVYLLDGQYHTIPVDKKAKGKVVIDELFRYLELKDLQEKEYFSVYYVDLSGCKIFLNPFKQIRKQVPNAASHTTWNLFFGVQFYATKLSMLADEMTRYLFVLQMCRDIKEKRIYADRSTKLQLVSLLVQANCGDYDPQEHKAGYVEPYIDMIYNPAEIPVGLDSSVTEVHKEKTGFRPCEADNAFFMITKSLYKYGQQIFPVHDRLSQLGQIGASIVGLFFHKDGREFMNIPWEDVITVGYRKKKLRIKYHPKGSSEDTDHMLFLYCYEPNSKLVWRGCVEQHAFFRLERPTPLVKNTVKSFHSFNRNSELRFSRGRTLYQLLRSESKRQPEFQRSLPILYPIENTDGDPEPRPTVKSLSVATPPPITEPESSNPDDSKVYMTVEITKSEPDLTRVVEFSATEKQKCSFTVTFKERTPSPPMMSNSDRKYGAYMDNLDPAAQDQNSDVQDGTVTAIACEIEVHTPSPTYDETKAELIDHIKGANCNVDEETHLECKTNVDHETQIHEDYVDQEIYVDEDDDDDDDDISEIQNDDDHDHDINDDQEIQNDDDDDDDEIHDHGTYDHEIHAHVEHMIHDDRDVHIDHDHDTHVNHNMHVDHETHNDHEGPEAIPLAVVDQDLESKITEEDEAIPLMEVFPVIFQRKKDLERWGKIFLFYVHFLTFYLILFLLTRLSYLYAHD